MSHFWTMAVSKRNFNMYVYRCKAFSHFQYLSVRPGIERDKTMADKLMYIINNHKITPFVG